MARLPRYLPNASVRGEDLNLILSILDTGNANLNSATNSGLVGDSLSPTTPDVSGSSSSLGNGQAPATVRGLTGSYGIDNFSQSHTAYVLLSWTPNPISDFVSRYDIYYHKGADPTLYNLSVGGDVNVCRVNNLFPGNVYSFSAQAHDAANRTSLWCPEVNVNISLDSDPPAIPTGLTATATATGVYLTWTEVGVEGLSNDLKQYQIAVSLDGGGTYPTVRTVGPGNAYFYTPTTSNQGTVFFKVATVDWTGNVSAYSAAVSAAVGTILGPLTVNPGGLTVTTSNLTITAGNLIFGGTSAKVIPGATSLLFRNTADNATNLTITDAGAFTMRAGLTITAGGETITAGDLTLTAGNLIFTAASSKIIPGATSLLFRNTADSATNATITDAGLITLRNAIKLPPASAGTVAPTSYGSLPVKIDEQTPTGTSFTFASIPQGFRHLLIEGASSTNEAANVSELGLRFNSDSGSGNYMDQRHNLAGTTVTNQESGATARTAIRNWWTGAANAYFGSGIHRIYIPYYTQNGNYLKFVRLESTFYNGTTFQVAGKMNCDTYTGVWNSTGNITDITILVLTGSASFASPTTWTLYGIP